MKMDRIVKLHITNMFDKYAGSSDDFLEWGDSGAPLPNYIQEYSGANMDLYGSSVSKYYRLDDRCKEIVSGLRVFLGAKVNETERDLREFSQAVDYLTELVNN